MTNYERIKQMTLEEFIIFLKNCNLTGTFPIVEGNRFYTYEEMLVWFGKESKE